MKLWQKITIRLNALILYACSQTTVLPVNQNSVQAPAQTHVAQPQPTSTNLHLAPSSATNQIFPPVQSTPL